MYRTIDITTVPLGNKQAAECSKPFSVIFCSEDIIGKKLVSAELIQ